MKKNTKVKKSKAGLTYRLMPFTDSQLDFFEQEKERTGTPLTQHHRLAIQEYIARKQNELKQASGE